jgi:hypothetical protein
LELFSTGELVAQAMNEHVVVAALREQAVGIMLVDSAPMLRRACT